MFEKHFALRENPFASGHQSRFVYPSPEHQEAIAHLRFGIENREPFVLITGEVGTGKTTALYEVLAEWKSRVIVALVTNSALSRNELLEEIALRLGFAVPGGSTKPQLLAHLERHLLALRSKGERAILLLDEAQNLDRELLEEIRLLSNLEAQGEKLLQVFLLGQPELEAKLTQPELRQLRQRIAVHYRLTPLNADETERYIHHRIAVAGGHGASLFPRECCAEVYALTHGIPREINHVCSQAFLNAFVEDVRAVALSHVRAGADELEFKSVLPGIASIDPRTTAPAMEPPAAPPPAPAPPVAAPMPPAEAPRAAQPPTPAPPMVETPRPPEPAVETPRAHEPTVGPIDKHLLDELGGEVVEHVPASPATPATDEASWESWVRSLMAERPKEPAHEEPRRVEPPAPVAEPVAKLEPSATQPPPAPKEPPAVVAPRAIEPAAPTRPREPETPRVREPQGPRAIEPAAAPKAEPRPPVPLPVPPRARAAESARGRDEATRPEERRTPGRSDSWRPPLWTPESPSAMRASARAASDAAWIPPRLREKLEEPDEPGPRRGLQALGYSALVLVMVAAAVMLANKFGAFRFPWQGPAPATQTTTAPAAAVPDVAGQTPSAPSGGAEAGASGAPATNAAPAAATPAPSESPAKAEPPSSATGGLVPVQATQHPAAPVTHAPVAATQRSFGIAVGSYVDRQRANAERKRLGDASHLDAVVRPVRSGGATVYEVVLGSFRDRASADQAAGDLIDRSIVDEARVVAQNVRAPGR